MQLPQHIAIIMDGNGRWAKQRNMPVSYGHKCGADAIQNLIEQSDELGIKYITAYTFSTENWKRPKSEVAYLMTLLQDFLNDTSGRLERSNIRIKFIGSRDRIKKKMVESMERIEKISANKTGLTFIIALDYGARQEITQAVKKICTDVKAGTLDISQIDEQLISDYLYTKDIPDPDLIIRPSGEKRLSNFLLYQASYSELWYSDILWPDFTIEHLKQAITDYNGRKRRYGGRKIMKVRVVSAVVAILLLAVIVYMGETAIGLAVFALAAAGVREFNKALEKAGFKPVYILSYLSCLPLMYLAVSSLMPWQVIATMDGKYSDVAVLGLFVLVVLASCFVMFSGGRYKIADAAVTLLGLFYVVFLLSFVTLTRSMDKGYLYIWLIFIGAWATDTFAFFTGITI